MLFSLYMKKEGLLCSVFVIRSNFYCIADTGHHTNASSIENLL